MLSLGAFYLDEPYKGIHTAAGKEMTRTCRESYIQSVSKLGPEIFQLNSQPEAKGIPPDTAYALSADVVESYFILWRLTHDPIYREWGWDVAEALEKHCRVEGGGYSGLKDVNVEKPIKDDSQPSYFLAKTLKVGLYIKFTTFRRLLLLYSYSGFSDSISTYYSATMMSFLWTNGFLIKKRTRFLLTE